MLKSASKLKPSLQVQPNVPCVFTQWLIRDPTTGPSRDMAVDQLVSTGHMICLISYVASMSDTFTVIWAIIFNCAFIHIYTNSIIVMFKTKDTLTYTELFADHRQLDSRNFSRTSRVAFQKGQIIDLAALDLSG